MTVVDVLGRPHPDNPLCLLSLMLLTHTPSTPHPLTYTLSLTPHPTLGVRAPPQSSDGVGPDQRHPLPASSPAGHHRSAEQRRGHVSGRDLWGSFMMCGREYNMSLPREVSELLQPLGKASAPVETIGRQGQSLRQLRGFMKSLSFPRDRQGHISPLTGMCTLFVHMLISMLRPEVLPALAAINVIGQNRLTMVSDSVQPSASTSRTCIRKVYVH